ncbi:hypothetical protein HPB47_012188 [Ixodes persulcatus]|uniref:Uncharacterized protein n=1 Tax=Ixodes persulcatus TaxID=34615 RepID=A0AC60NU89_IXOPE|nr:hypothetical protein HPB47_012188 [Ixodes persulcatus]
MQTDFSDLLTLATAADAFAWSPLQREAEMPTLQREAPYGAPLAPSVAPTPLRTGAITPGSSLNAPAPPPAQSEAYRSPHGETAAAPHHTLLENAARHPDESLLEFVRAMQELFELAEPSAPHAERVERVIRQSHPTFAAYLRGSRFRDLNELASEARRLQGDILAARAYRPPPPASAALEPRCAWSGDTPSRAPRRYDSANYAEDRGRDTYAISDRALDPYSYGRRTSRPTPQFRTTDSRPNEAARQEETRIPQSQRADARYDRAGENQNARQNPRRGDDRSHAACQGERKPDCRRCCAAMTQCSRTDRAAQTKCDIALTRATNCQGGRTRDP